MSDQAIFAKTAAGQQEIGARNAGLDPRHRRLLILVDGRRSVAELRALSGPVDAAAMLAELQARGLIAAVGGATAARTGSGSGTGQAPPISATDWRGRGRRAARALIDLLGPMGESLALQLEAMKSPEALDSLLPRARTLVEGMRGKAALERFEQMLADDS